MYIAAVIHDFGHKGVNNDFLIKSHDRLALLYNDRSPMVGWLRWYRVHLVLRTETQSIVSLMVD